jgi:hypothetical protein
VLGTAGQNTSNFGLGMSTRYLTRLKAELHP